MIRITKEVLIKLKKKRETEGIGIIKEFDKLGRLVIPKDLRERYALDNKVEIVATKQGVLIKSPEYVLVKKRKESLDDAGSPLIFALRNFSPFFFLAM